MSKPSLDFSTQRAVLLQQMAAIDSMEVGSLKAEYRTHSSGRKSGPYFKHQVWTEGGNLSQRISSEDAPALKEAIKNRQRFEQLSADFIAVTVEQTRQEHAPLELKKKTPLTAAVQAQEGELDELMARFAASAPSGELLQQLEPWVRAAVFKPANAVVGLLLQHAIDVFDAGYQPKLGYEFKGRATLQVQCLFGDHEVLRDYYYNDERKEGYCPADSALGLENGYTPWLARLSCRQGSSSRCFREAAENLAETGGVKVSARQIQRLVQKIGPSAEAWQKREATPGESDAEVIYLSADGTGVPALPSETKDRAAKAEGPAKTRQAYLGCVFTQHECDEKGHPVRDADSTTYISSMETIHEFGPQLRQEALRRGLGAVPQSVLLIDGASGLENMGLSCFPNTTRIVDFYHAMQHAGAVLTAWHGPHPADCPKHKKRLRHWAQQLLKNRVQHLIDTAQAAAAGTSAEPAVQKALGYFENNVQRMQYQTYRDKGYFIGSGVVEAGCKAVIGGRGKQSGMRWTVRGAENILAFRCIQSSRRLDEFWKHHLNLRAAENDQLQLAA